MVFSWAEAKPIAAKATVAKTVLIKTRFMSVSPDENMVVR
jgi:hypothetical protein